MHIKYTNAERLVFGMRVFSAIEEGDSTLVFVLVGKPLVYFKLSSVFEIEERLGRTPAFRAHTGFHAKQSMSA